jgi:hypothetical protein
VAGASRFLSGLLVIAAVALAGCEGPMLDIDCEKKTVRAHGYTVEAVAQAYRSLCGERL